MRLAVSAGGVGGAVGFLACWLLVYQKPMYPGNCPMINPAIAGGGKQAHAARGVGGGLVEDEQPMEQPANDLAR